MTKSILLMAGWFLLAGLNLYGQDSTYYFSAFNSKGDSLKSRLHQIIRGHIQFPYTSSSTDVWDLLKHTDRDTLDSTKVILIYSNRSVDAAQEYNGGAGWSREHVWAKSRGNFGTAAGAGAGVHHLRPSSVGVNSSRNNRNFDNCQTCTNVLDKGTPTGSKRDANLWTFEPPDNVKGDVARMLFYMCVRYEGSNNEPDLELTDSLLTQTSQAPLHGNRNTLLAWHRADPVSNWERQRNRIIYGYQGNKNPFIDYPELAEYLWGDSTGVVWKPESNLGQQDLFQVEASVYPNPNRGIFTLSLNAQKGSIRIFDARSRLLLQTQAEGSHTQLDLSAYPAGIYWLRASAEGGIVTQKVWIR